MNDPVAKLRAVRAYGLGHIMRKAAILAAGLVAALGCASADAHSPNVSAERSLEGVEITIRAECGASIEATLRKSTHHATLRVTAGTEEKEPTTFAPSSFGELFDLMPGYCEGASAEGASLGIAAVTPLPRQETITFRVFINGAFVEGGRVVLTRHGSPPGLIWEGTDGFINYCINGLKKIVSINHRLACYYPGTLHEDARIVWEH